MTLPLYSIVPFILMLLCIALIPLINYGWWDRNYTKVSLLIGLPTAVVIAFVNGGWLYSTTIDYISFISLLASLFIISGGIHIKSNAKATPFTNSIILLTGAILANLIGTTGAAMLLIRPLININSARKHKTHLIVFFIFIVANIGGSLTPLGDPPLFLGFLQGVPFSWTFKLFPAWALNNALLVIVFFIIDSVFVKKDKIKQTRKTGVTLKISGKRNLIFLAGIMISVLILGDRHIEQTLAIIGMAILSLWFTPESYRKENNFMWAPIKEVAILFAAIFITMIPALKLLETMGAELGVYSPIQFFWATGTLSSFLDNAPTYLSFLSLGKSVSAGMAGSFITLFDGSHINQDILKAVSMGAVFMGANTYIGNGPNFMVKSIAERSKIKMPSFFGYMLWAILILIPLFILDTFIFFM
ncbi:MAG: sodium:proton antiporter [Pseudomonadota bacterium]